MKSGYTQKQFDMTWIRIEDMLVFSDGIIFGIDIPAFKKCGITLSMRPINKEIKIC
jgi:hypothetical protein